MSEDDYQEDTWGDETFVEQERTPGTALPDLSAEEMAAAQLRKEWYEFAPIVAQKFGTKKPEDAPFPIRGELRKALNRINILPEQDLELRIIAKDLLYDCKFRNDGLTELQAQWHQASDVPDGMANTLIRRAKNRVATEHYSSPLKRTATIDMLLNQYGTFEGGIALYLFRGNKTDPKSAPAVTGYDAAMHALLVMKTLNLFYGGYELSQERAKGEDAASARSEIIGSKYLRRAAAYEIGLNWGLPAICDAVEGKNPLPDVTALATKIKDKVTAAIKTSENLRRLPGVDHIFGKYLGPAADIARDTMDPISKTAADYALGAHEQSEEKSFGDFLIEHGQKYFKKEASVFQRFGALTGRFFHIAFERKPVATSLLLYEVATHAMTNELQELNAGVWGYKTPAQKGE
jgi:hypothetical protein